MLAQYQAEAAAQKTLEETIRQLRQVQEEQDQFAEFATNTIASNFTAILTGTKDARDAFRDLGNTILTEVVNNLIKAAIEAAGLKAILGSSGFGFLGGLFGGGGGSINSGAPGFRQRGGPVTAGRSYVVGEAGPELFVPRGSGEIVPNGQFGGNTFIFAPNVSNASLEARREIRESYEPFKQGIKADVAVDNRRRSVIRDSGRR